MGGEALGEQGRGGDEVGEGCYSGHEEEVLVSVFVSVIFP